MRIASLSLICFSFGVAVVAIMSAARRRDLTAKLFLVFSICVSGWALPMALWLGEAVSVEKTYGLMKISTAFACVIPLAWFHFINAFVGSRSAYRGLYFALYPLTLSLVCASLFAETFILKPKVYGAEMYAVLPGSYYWVKTLLYVILVPLGFGILFRAYFAKDSQEKNQIGYLLMATILGFIGGGSTIVAVYIRSLHLDLVPLMVAYPFLMGIALVKHGLFSDYDFAAAAHRDKLATLGTLMSSISHEIRNPLYVVKGAVDSFFKNEEDGVFTDKEESFRYARDCLKKAGSQTERTLDIVKTFSGFAKRDLREEPAFKAVSMPKIIERVLLLVNHEFELDKIHLRLSLPQDFLTVRADERYLEEILFNLIMNSCQAMKNTGGELVISAVNEKDRVVISIQDNGPGIPRELQKQIFEPFYTTKEEGTGLGLYITKQLVEKVGGKISVESELGRGTVFRLEFKSV